MSNSNQQSLYPEQILAVENILMDEESDAIKMKYEFPASFKKAKLHRMAVKFGYNAQRTQKKPDLKNISKKSLDDEISFKKPKLCPCCNLPVNTQNIPIGYPTSFIPG